jgi:hypothetical protein
MLNRSLLLVRAKQPFLDWLRSLPDPVDDSTTLEFVHEGGSAYLLPEYEDDKRRDVLLRQGFRMIFEDQLAGWWTAEADWPRTRTLPVFLEWFDLEWHSLVADLVDGPLLDE